MTFLLTNDDGIDAPGLRAMQRAIAQIHAAPTVLVAPKNHQSGCSHQTSTHRPIAVEQRAEREFAVDGTPVDCTRLGLRYLQPDATWVLSGINAGGNLGADVYVSGTVAAVREAALLRFPGIAISHYIHRGRAIDWDRATDLAVQVLQTLLAEPLPEGAFWNVNLPHLTPQDPDPKLIHCPCCTQPLPTDFQLDQDQFIYVGDYAKRPRDPGSDTEVCFSGHIAITRIHLW
jgi:5'-nucleotidase